jgi:hypothetical protein
MRCKASPPKRKTPKGHGKASKYAHGFKGHSWIKLIYEKMHIGRKCKRCNKIILNARGIEYKKKMDVK